MSSHVTADALGGAPSWRLEAPEGERGAGEVRYLSWSRLVWRHFRRHPLALLGAALLLFIILVAWGGPHVAPGPPPNLNGTAATLAQAQAALQIDVAPRLSSWRYLLGTDAQANPIMMSVLDGGSAPLQIGILGALLATLIGIFAGAVSGYLGGWLDTLWMRVADGVLAMPFVPLLLLAVTSLANTQVYGVRGYVVLFGLLGWPPTARLVRGYVLSMRDWEFVLAARAAGLSEPAIIFRHVLRNILGVMVVSFTLNVAIFIGVEVAIEFLGGPPPQTITWGRALFAAYQGDELLHGAWWTVFFPALAALFAILGANLLGDGLRDAIEGSTHDATDVTTSTRTGIVSRALVTVTGTLTPVTLRGGSSLAAMRAHAARHRAQAGARAYRVRPLRLAADRVAAFALPVAIAVPVMVLIVLASGVAFLADHAPVSAARDYTAPVRLAAITPGYDVGAHLLPDGGWDLLYLDPRLNLTSNRVDAHGHVLSTGVVAPHVGQSSQPSLAVGPRDILAVWLTDRNGEDTLWGAYLGVAAGGSRPFPLAVGGSMEHPTAVAVPGGFDVVFGRQVGSAYDLYLAFLPPAARRPLWVRPLVRAPYHALLPRAVAEPNGDLFVLYLNLCCQMGAWNVTLQGFTPAGRPLGRPEILTQSTISKQDFTGPNEQPPTPLAWSMDLARAPDGSVWAVAMGDYEASIGHWSADGKVLLPPAPLCGPSTCVTVNGSLALVFPHRHGLLFYTTNESADTHSGLAPYALPIAPNGGAGAPERIAYDYGGGAANIVAGAAGDTVAALWEKSVYGGPSILEGVIHHAPVTPSVASRLGLSVGPVWANAVLLTIGSVLGGALLAAVNVFLLALLLAVWFVLSRMVPTTLRWPLYIPAVFIVLALLLAVRASAPGFVFLIPA